MIIIAIAGLYFGVAIGGLLLCESIPDLSGLRRQTWLFPIMLLVCICRQLLSFDLGIRETFSLICVPHKTLFIAYSVQQVSGMTSYNKSKDNDLKLESHNSRISLFFEKIDQIYKNYTNLSKKCYEISDTTSAERRMTSILVFGGGILLGILAFFWLKDTFRDSMLIIIGTFILLHSCSILLSYFVEQIRNKLDSNNEYFAELNSIKINIMKERLRIKAKAMIESQCELSSELDFAEYYSSLLKSISMENMDCSECLKNDSQVYIVFSRITSTHDTPIIMRLALENGAIVLEARNDSLKLEKFSDERALHSIVHVDSDLSISEPDDDLIYNCISNRYNLVISSTQQNLDSLRDSIEHLLKANYNIHMIYIGTKKRYTKKSYTKKLELEKIRNVSSKVIALRPTIPFLPHTYFDFSKFTSFAWLQVGTTEESKLRVVKATEKSPVNNWR